MNVNLAILIALPVLTRLSGSAQTYQMMEREHIVCQAVTISIACCNIYNLKLINLLDFYQTLLSTNKNLVI